jgi:hypothetical protein
MRDDDRERSAADAKVYVVHQRARRISIVHSQRFSNFDNKRTDFEHHVQAFKAILWLNGSMAYILGDCRVRDRYGELSATPRTKALLTP